MMDESSSATVLLIPSEKASIVGRKNGLSLSQLLQPFSRLGTSVPFRSPLKSYALNNFGVRLVEPQEMQPVSLILDRLFDCINTVLGSS